MSEHTILVAFTVEADTEVDAHLRLQGRLPQPGDAITSWWVAEDDRIDGSDNDSAVFVPRGAQRDIESLIRGWIGSRTDEWHEDGYPYADSDVSGAWFA